MPARDQRLLLGAAFATSALLLLATMAGHADLLPYAAPVFLLAVPPWLAITALAVGALGLLAGIGGLMAGRRRAT
jgi:hypothetical protein